MKKEIKKEDVLNLVGRYEYVNYNSNKYYSIKYLKDDEYEITYGAIGKIQDKYIVNQEDAFKKVKEKIRKGYKKVFSNELDFYHEKILLTYIVKIDDSNILKKNTKFKL